MEGDVTIEAEFAPPTLVILPDPEARVDLSEPLLGKPLGARLVKSALDAGFASALAAPGTSAASDQCVEVPVAEPVGGPALVIFEGTYVDPALIRLMVEHPLGPGERYSLYDGAGRPAACFVGDLDVVPGIMPISEELDWPEELGPDRLARVVYPEDRARAEWLLVQHDGVLRGFAPPPRGAREREISPGPGSDAARYSVWDREINLRTLRWMAARRVSVAQLELLALLTAVAAGPVSLMAHGLTLVAASLLLFLGVHVSSLLRSLRVLRQGGADCDDPRGSWIPGETIASATRPLAHAVLTAALTYVLVAERDRSSVAGLVLLVAGGAATVLSLAYTRSLLRGMDRGTLALPDGRSVLRRLGVELPSWLQGAPLLEFMVLLAAFTGRAAFPWAVLFAAAVSRLWRWFSAPPRAAPTSEP